MSPTPLVAPVRKRKATLQPVKMEDIKIEYVDLCLAVPSAEGSTIIEGFGGAPTTALLVSPPLTPMEVTIDTGVEEEEEEEHGEQVKQPRKRRKLDHLSPEEKSQHRKMMNRMSAQSARDRQKALMQQQEQKIKALQQTTDKLKKQNQALVVTAQTLVNENKSLKEDNARLSQRVLDLEMKLSAGSVLTGIVKQEKEEDATGSVATYEVCANTPPVNSANAIVNAAAVSSSGSIPLEPAALHAIPLQKGLEEPPQCLQQQQQSQQQSYLLAESAQSQKVTPNQAAILLLLMSYLGIWTHLKSCKSLETSLSRFSAEMMPKPKSVSEKTWSRLKTLLHKWLEMNNPVSPNLEVKREILSPPLSPMPG